MPGNGTVILQPGRERSVLRRHPWIFSGAVARIRGDPADGDIVDVQDAGGQWRARGYLNRRSQITVRLLTWDPAEEINADFWKRRLQRALQGHADLLRSPHTTAFRLVHAESDGLPGLIVDRYGEFLVAQFLTLGIERWKDTKDINLQAFHLLRPGGILFSTSCSGAVSADLFQKILFGAALDAGRDVQILGHLHQGSDHPVSLNFPEGTYLKGFICRAL